MSDKVYIGRRVRSIEKSPAHQPFSEVEIFCDDENVYVAGNAGGRVLSAACPWVTQAIADDVLSKVTGFVYTPFSAQGAVYDPSAELGDGVTVDGVYAPLAIEGIIFDRSCDTDIEAPAEEEIDHEIPYKTPAQRQTDRKIAQTKSEIKKLAGQIQLKVSGEEAQSLIDQSIDKIELSVQSAYGYTAFVLKAGEVELSTKALYLTVDAVNITGKLKASQIETDDLEVDAANVSGTLTAAQVNLNGLLTLRDDDDNEYGYMGTSQVSSQEGYGVTLMDSSGENAFFAMSTGVRMWCGGYENQVSVTSEGPSFRAGGSYYYVRSDHFSPGTHTPELGVSSRPWGQIYSNVSTISTSDRNKKNSIVYDIDERYDALWGLLKPCTGKYNDGTSGRTHMFLISQDVEDAIDGAGLTSLDFAAFIKSPKRDADGNVVDGYDYALRYEEFIPLCIRQIQMLQRRVAELEARV